MNREPLATRVELRINDVKNDGVGPIVLDNEGKWEQTVSFTPDKAQDNEKLEFLLFKDNDMKSFSNSLHLWINVKSR